MAKEMEVIHVGLYGGKSIFSGRETPLEASIISCGMKDQCSLFAQGQCAAIRSIGSSGCKHGKQTVKRGYTSRAMKYHQFKNEWRNHEKYGALESNTKKLAIIGDEVYFSYPYVNLKVDDNGNIAIDGPTLSFGNSVAFIPIENFTKDLIKRICDYRPRAIMGGTIGSYEKEVVPLFLSHLKEVFPKLFAEFTNKYKEYGESINYVGRKAYIHSLEPCDVEDKSGRYPNLNNTWYWDGEHLNYKSGYISSMSIVSHYEIHELKIKPSENATVEITSNDQVTDKTKFVD